MSNYDYTGNNNSASCAYAPLGQYNQGYAFGFTPKGKSTSGYYIVPVWDPINHYSLIYPVPTCSGYPNIEAAYGKDAGQCQTTYRTTSCVNKK